MTFKAEKKRLADIGVTLRGKNDCGEYRVNIVYGDEATAYYTDDLDDAVNTGFAMAMREAQQALTENGWTLRRDLGLAVDEVYENKDKVDGDRLFALNARSLRRVRQVVGIAAN